MKFILLMNHNHHFIHVSSIVWQLCHRGHTVKILFSRHKPRYQENAIREWLEANPGCQVGQMQKRRGLWNLILSWLHHTKNFRIYLLPQHPAPGRAQNYLSSERQVTSFPVFDTLGRFLIGNWLGKRLLATTWSGRFLDWIERAIPPDAGLIHWLEQEKPQAVIAITNLLPSQEGEYLRAAHHLKIPTVHMTASWDNLTTKGTLQFIPDLLFLWNKPMAEEGLTIHGFPQQKIVLTGAPSFDYWFEMKPTLDRRAFFQRAGLDPQKKYIVYVAISKDAMKDEADLLGEFACRLRQNPDTANINILIRPHPLDPHKWDDFHGPNVSVWPKEGELVSNEEGRLEFYHTFCYCEAVAGVNTTGMIDAAINGKACINLDTGLYGYSHTVYPHFLHLVRAGFLEPATDLSQAVQVVTAILDGEDGRADQRRQFVKDFIRPCGLEQPAGKVVARAIELVALGKTAAEINAEVCGK